MSELTLSLWRSAPLDARLRFASELLPVEDPLQGSLKEAIGVVQLWRRGPELEAWAKAYPSLVVDTAAALKVPGTGEDEAHTVAGDLLRETRGLLDSSLRAFGFEWITPRPGDSPPSDSRSEGSGTVVAVCLRPGLRHHGTLLIPAEVQVVSEETEVPAAPECVSPPPARSLGAISGGGECTPEWLRTLQQRGGGAHLPALESLAASGSEAGDGVILAAIDGLREELNGEDGGPPLKRWLKDELNVDVLQPTQGEPFDPTTMHALSERRTVHEHEADTVARLERAGLMREGRVLAPAEVVRYVAGEAW